MSWTALDWAKTVGGELCGPDVTITSYATDSRDVKDGSCFIAIRGAKVDGHEFVAGAFGAGAACALVERNSGLGTEILVPNVIEALGTFARTIRNNFDGPVLGITGSNGKTTTKEFIAAALSSLGDVLKSQGNRNSEFTSPLAWVEATGREKSAVIEMGMRGFGQIAHLASFSRPTIGVITVVGTAHVEMVGTRLGISKAKAELLTNLVGEKVSVLWAEDDYLDELRQHAPGPVRTFGFSPDAECRIMGYRSDGYSASIIRGTLDGQSFEGRIPVLGRHQANNAAAAILAAHTAGIPVRVAAAAIESAVLPPMRMEVLTRDGVTYILDFYNASPDSTVAAIAAIAEVPTNGRRFVVLGEMLELGDFSETGHRMVGAALGTAPVDRVLLTGGFTSYIAQEALKAGFPPDRISQLSSLDYHAIREFLSQSGPGDLVLMKGSRALQLERALEMGS